MGEIKAIDARQCQSETKSGSFMTFGPRVWKRCQERPTVIAVEKKPDSEDGLIGGMSLCDKCLGNMKAEMGENYATVLKIIPF